MTPWMVWRLIGAWPAGKRSILAPLFSLSNRSTVGVWIVGRWIVLEVEGPVARWEEYLSLSRWCREGVGYAAEVVWEQTSNGEMWERRRAGPFRIWTGLRILRPGLGWRTGLRNFTARTWFRSISVLCFIVQGGQIVVSSLSISRGRLIWSFEDVPLGSQTSDRFLEIVLADNFPLLRICKGDTMGTLSVTNHLAGNCYDDLRLVQRVLNIPSSKPIRYGCYLAPVHGGLSGYVPRPVLFEQG